MRVRERSCAGLFFMYYTVLAGKDFKGFKREKLHEFQAYGESMLL